MTTDGFDIVRLPTAYSEEDAQVVSRIGQELAILRQAYHRDAQPYIDLLAKIDGRYVPRFALVPKAGKASTGNGELSDVVQ